uniref:Uncharacterized protein n=1 Tax=Romanomermis culicivorax TaxID=13658 RepID=A0A915HEI2_ROMCU
MQLTNPILISRFVVGAVAHFFDWLALFPMFFIFFILMALVSHTKIAGKFVKFVDEGRRKMENNSSNRASSSHGVIASFLATVAFDDKTSRK